MFVTESWHCPARVCGSRDEQLAEQTNSAKGSHTLQGCCRGDITEGQINTPTPINEVIKPEALCYVGFVKSLLSPLIINFYLSVPDAHISR